MHARNEENNDTSSRRDGTTSKGPEPQTSKLSSFTHLNTKGEVRMVHLSPSKPATERTATAQTLISFSNDIPYHMLNPRPPQKQTHIGKGDILATARIAGITGAKMTSSLIPLCHNIPISGTSIDITIIPPLTDLKFPHGGLEIHATVHTQGQTGVEMEALVAASTAGLSVYDMCKAVDRGMLLLSTRIVRKSGGRSGDWRFEKDGRGVGEGSLLRDE